MYFRTNYNQEEGVITPRKFEVNDKPSETIPDMAMSIQEMLARAASGLPLDGGKVPMYEGDENTDDDDLVGHPDLSKMDLAERQEYIEYQQQNLATLKERLRLAKQLQKEEQSSKVERTSGDGDDQGTTDQPGQNILKKPGVQGQRPATAKEASPDA